MALIVMLVGVAFAASAGAAFEQVQQKLGIQDNHMGMSMTWGDYDGNGYPDFFVNGYRRHPELLYQNRGNGTFFRADTVAGVAADRQWPALSGFGSGWGDYDNDGDLDLLVVNTDGQVSFFYRNNGPDSFGVVTFTDVAAAVGLGAASSGVGVGWADYDGDGWLDVFISNAAALPDLLFHNLGNGTFENVSAKSGITDTATAAGCAWGDYDNDRDLDIFVNNAANWPKNLYRNNGNGTFTDVAAEAGVAKASSGQGCAWGDFDNDGDLDLFVANFGGEPNFFYTNNGNGTFTESASKVGVGNAVKSRGATWADVDNDGDLDLFVCVDWGPGGLLFLNNGNTTFANVGTKMGIVGGWAISNGWADYDNDGHLDLYVSTQVSHLDLLYRSTDTEGNWIKVEPLTAGPRTKKKDAAGPWRLALGAWVEVDLDGGADFAKGPGRYVAMMVGAGDGLASSAVPAHLGCGKAKKVDVRVTYPTGQVIKLTGVPVNQKHTVKDR